MKNVIKKTIIFSFLFTAILSSSIYSNESKWELEIKLDKEDFLLYEPIWLDIYLINSTSEILQTHGLRAPNHDQFTIELKDGTGQSVEYTGPQMTLTGGPGELLLGAREHEYRSFNLLYLFPSNEEISGYRLLNRIHFIPKGKFTVRVLFEDAVSDEITFNILEPDGEEKEALELIEEASRIWKQKNPDPSAQIFKQIVDRFPNSVYAENCFYLSRIYSKAIWEGYRQGTYDLKILDEEMLEKFPNSGNTRGMLLKIIRDMDDDAKLELLDSLQRDDPNTRRYKFIEQMRRRIVKLKAGE